MDIDRQSEIEPDSRRDFLRNLLTGATTATVLMVFGPGAAALSDPKRRVKSEAKHQFAYVIDINRCIGCGNCVRACNKENNVPAGVFRTWVER